MATDFHPAVSCRDLKKRYNAEVLGIEDLSLIYLTGRSLDF